MWKIELPEVRNVILNYVIIRKYRVCKGLLSYYCVVLSNADGVIGIGITATAVGLLVGGIAAAVTRKK